MNKAEEHKFSRALRSDEIAYLESLFNRKNSLVECSGIVQLYVREKPWYNKWVKLGAGLICFERDNSLKSYFFRFYEIKIDSCALKWQNEMFYPFKYSELTKTFHSFSTEEQIIGLNFAFENESTLFAKAVNERIQKRDLRQQNSEKGKLTELVKRLNLEPTEENIKLVQNLRKSLEAEEKMPKSQQTAIAPPKPVVQASKSIVEVPKARPTQKSGPAFDLSKEPPSYEPPKPQKRERNQQKKTEITKTTAETNAIPPAPMLDTQNSGNAFLSSIHSFDRGTLKQVRNNAEANGKNAAIVSRLENSASAAATNQLSEQRVTTIVSSDSYENRADFLRQIQAFQKDRLKSVKAPETKKKPAVNSINNSSIMTALRNMNLDVYGKKDEKIYDDDFK